MRTRELAVAAAGALLVRGFGRPEALAGTGESLESQCGVQLKRSSSACIGERAETGLNPKQ